MRVRTLNTGFHDIYYNFGLDQALMEEVEKTGEPILRFYTCNPRSVSIGCMQKAKSQIDLDVAEKVGCQFSRRITGGELVFHEYELTYSFIIPVNSDFVRKPVIESCEDMGKGVVAALKYLAINAEFAADNSFVANEKKIATNMQIRSEKVILQQGTVILDLDFEILKQVLKVENSDSLSSVSLQAGRKIDFDEMADLMFQGYKKSFLQLSFEPSEVSPNEEIKALDYAKNKYATDDWKFKF